MTKNKKKIRKFSDEKKSYMNRNYDRDRKKNNDRSGTILQ